MKYPCLVPKSLCKVPIAVHLTGEGITEDGDPERTLDLSLLCNFQDSVKTIFTEEKKLVECTGTAYFPGDIAENFPSLSGAPVTVFSEEREIVHGMKARNPDGTVNYCKLEVK